MNLQDSVKVLFEFHDGATFGTEIDSLDAAIIVADWINGEKEVIEADMYDVRSKDIKEIKFIK
jgi:hypothetical protein